MFTFEDLYRAGFCCWGVWGQDGSSLIIHWSSGSHKRSTNWANQYDIYFGGAPTDGAWVHGPLDPLNRALYLCKVYRLSIQYTSEYP